MSKLDELIRGYCPEGVEYMQLGAIEDAGLIKLGRGNVISKKDIAAEPGDYPIYSSSASGVGEFGRYGKYMFDDERLSWSVDGGGRFFYRHPHKYSVTNVSGWLKVLDSSRIDIKYLFYALDSAWSTKKFDYTKKAHPSVIRNEYKIPVPPLEVQKEIVNILDKFTQLEAELSAELDARRMQYEYYRGNLLQFSEEVQWMTLQDVAALKNGSDWKKLGSGDIPVYGTGGVMTRVNKFAYNKPTVLIPRKGSITNVYYLEEPFWNVDTIYYTIIDETKIIPKFFFYYMKTIDLMKLDMGSGRPSLTQAILNKIRVPVPPLEDQSRIVAVLDNFEKLVTSISEGLPAEINARRQQYEYYRTKLLTFQEFPA